MKKSVVCVMLGLVVVAMFFIACEQAPEGVVAKVGKYNITGDELKEQTQMMQSRWKTATEAYEGYMSALEGLIQQKLILLKAYKEGLDKDSSVVQSLDENDLRLKLYALWELEIVQKVNITDEELKELYDKRGTEYNAAHILLPDSAKAVEVYNKLKEGADFEELAKEYSQDPGSAPRGGDLGWFTDGRMVPVFQDAVYALEDGELSEPVKSRFGWHIILRKGTRPAEQKPFEETKEMLRKNIERQRQQERMMEYIEETRERANLTYNDENIQVILNKFQRPVEPENSEMPISANIEFTPEELELPILTWTGGTWTIAQFDSLYKQESPSRRPVFSAIEEIQNFLADRLQQDILLAEAERINITESEKYKELFTKALEEKMVNAMQSKLYTDVDVTDDEIQAYYDANPDSFMNPRTIVVLDIQVSSEDDAKKLYNKIKGGADFVEVADENSERTYIKRSGWKLEVTEQRFPNLYAAANNASPGDLLGPIKDRFNKWCIIKVEEIRPEAPRPFEQVSRQIAGKLRIEKRKTALDDFMASARAEFGVKMYEDAVAALIDSSRYEPAKGDTVVHGKPSATP